MSATKVSIAVALILLSIWVGVRAFWVVPIDNACNIFVGESVPNETPALEGSGADWVLTVSFVRDANEEAKQFYLATYLGAQNFHILSTDRRFNATSQGGYLKIKVASQVQAEELVNDLCLKL